MTTFIDERTVFNTPVLFAALPIRNVDKFPLAATVASVANIEAFTTANTGAITVTELQKGFIGQRIFILGDGFTTIENNTTIKTNTAANKLLAVNKVYRFTNFNNVWIEDEGGAGGGGGGGVAGLDTEIQYNNAGVLGSNSNFVYKIATGYGLKVGTTDNTKYGVKIADASQVGYFQFFGKQIVAFGQETPALLTSLLNPAYAGTAFIITSDNVRNGGNNDASIYLLSGASGPYAEMGNQIVATGDHGLRLHYNLIADAAGFHSYVSTVAGQQLSFEADGAMGLEYTKPSATTANTYDSLPGKAFKWYGGGWPGGAGGIKGKYVMFTSGEPGRGMDLAVEDGGTGSSYATRIRIDDSSNANPIYLYIGGSLRNVTIDGSGFLKG